MRFFFLVLFGLVFFLGSVSASVLSNDLAMDQEAKLSTGGKYEFVPVTDYGDGFYTVHEYLTPEGDRGYVMYFFTSEMQLEEVKGFGVLEQEFTKVLPIQVSTSTKI